MREKERSEDHLHQGINKDEVHVILSSFFSSFASHISKAKFQGQMGLPQLLS